MTLKEKLEQALYHVSEAHKGTDRPSEADTVRSDLGAAMALLCKAIEELPTISDRVAEFHGRNGEDSVRRLLGLPHKG